MSRLTAARLTLIKQIILDKYFRNIFTFRF